MTIKTSVIGALKNFITHTDGWENIVSGLGTSRDKRTAMGFAAQLVADEVTCDTLFGDDIFDRLCSLLPEDETREWISIGTDVDGKIGDKLDSLGVRALVTDARIWSRAFGGALLVIGADDGQAMDRPLKMEQVKAYEWNRVVNRFRVRVNTLYADPKHPKFMLPETYEILPGTLQAGVSQRGPFVNQQTLIVHETRTCRFDGLRCPPNRRALNNGWGESLIIKCMDVVRDFRAAYDSLAAFMQEFGISVYKIKDLAAMLASDAENLVMRRLTMLDMAKSQTRSVPLDAEQEEYQRVGMTVSGLSDLFQRLDNRLSLSSGIPVTLLMGVPQGGLNSTGEGDQRNWYNKVAASQETQLRIPLTYIVTILGHLLKVKPKDGSTTHAITFNPLWLITDKEREETRLMTSKRDEIEIRSGVLGAGEVRKNRYGGDRYSFETSLDEKDEAKPHPTGDHEGVVAIMGLVSDGTITPLAAQAMLENVLHYDSATAALFVAGAKAAPVPVAKPFGGI